MTWSCGDCALFWLMVACSLAASVNLFWFVHRVERFRRASRASFEAMSRHCADALDKCWALTEENAALHAKLAEYEGAHDKA